MQLPLFTPCASWSPPSLSSLPQWGDARRIAIDVESRDDHLRTLGPGWRRGAYITGVAVAIEDGPKFYLPIRHAEGDNLDEHAVIGYLREQAANFRGTVVGANLGYDLDGLANEGIEFKQAQWFRDVTIAEPLLDELQYSYSLENIGQRRLGVGKDERGLIEAAFAYGCKKEKDVKKWIWRLPARFVGPYAEQDVALPLAILRAQEREIEEQNLWNVFDLESRLLPVLVRMRRRGIRVDQDRLSQIERWAIQQEEIALAEVARDTGVRINVGDTFKPLVVEPALRAIGVICPRTTKDGPSITKEFLESIDHPVAAYLRRARKMSQLRTTFVNSIREHLTNGRIHCTLNQLRHQKEGEDDTEGAAYGRLSSSNPNMQQQPARDEEIGPMWRSIYLPEEGGLWCSDDYSQQEPRWLVHWAVVAGRHRLISERAFKAALEAAAKYRDDPSTDNHQMMADMAGIKRKDAKELFLGKIYGMGGPKLCQKLGLPTMLAVYIKGRGVVPTTDPIAQQAIREGARVFEAAGPEGQALINKFDQKVPFATEMAKAAEKRARAVGFITTYSGRRCRFPQLPDGTYDWTHKALNRLIQGSSADQTKQAMVELDAAGHYLQLQVHDEINGTVADRAEAERMARIMCECVRMELPSKVDVEVGVSWGEAT